MPFGYRFLKIKKQYVCQTEFNPLGKNIGCLHLDRSQSWEISPDFCLNKYSVLKLDLFQKCQNQNLHFWIIS